MPWWVLNRPIHTSWIVMVFCFFLSIGVFLSKLVNYFSNIWFLIVGLAFLFFVCYRGRVFVILLAIIGGLMCGLWRGSIAYIDGSEFSQYYGKNIQVVGTIKNNLDIGDSEKLSIELELSKINNVSIDGRIWITIYNSDINKGDKVVINGEILEGFGNYNGVIYRAKLVSVVSRSPSNRLSDFKNVFSKAIEKSMGETESKLGLGFLLGQKKNLPQSLILALQTVGLTHIIVASGYNLTILVRFSRRIFEKISKYLSMVFSVFMIVAFISITGLSPSMSRAGFVSILCLMTWYYGRKFHPVVLLSIAMAVTLIFNPSYAWGDIGWQLSFMAFAGVMILAPLLQRYFFGDKKIGFIKQILGETISAQIVTAPIIIMSFGQISNLAIIANLLILPLVPLTMFLTFIAGLGSLIFPSYASMIGLPAKFILDYMIEVIKGLSNIPWAVSKFELSIIFWVLYYVFVVIACVYLSRKTGYKLRDTNLVE